MIPSSNEFPIFNKRPIRFIVFWTVFPFLVILMNVMCFVCHPIEYPKNVVKYIFGKR